MRELVVTQAPFKLFMTRQAVSIAYQKMVFSQLKAYKERVEIPERLKAYELQDQLFDEVEQMSLAFGKRLVALEKLFGINTHEVEVEVENDETHSGDGRCQICMEPFSMAGDHYICYLLCRHAYGFSCIREWLQTGKKDKCPVCRRGCEVTDIQKGYVPLPYDERVILKVNVEPFIPTIEGFKQFQEHIFNYFTALEHVSQQTKQCVATLRRNISYELLPQRAKQVELRAITFVNRVDDLGQMMDQKWMAPSSELPSSWRQVFQALEERLDVLQKLVLKSDLLEL